MRSETRAAAAVRAEINVTPLVDVCLVLLIIFMVVTPLLDEGVPVRLPEAARPAALADSEHDTVLTLRLGGALFVGDDEVTQEALAARLRALSKAERAAIRVRGDGRLRYEDVRVLLNALAEEGIREVKLSARCLSAG